jgi:hypothetical protein
MQIQFALRVYGKRNVNDKISSKIIFLAMQLNLIFSNNHLYQPPL